MDQQHQEHLKTILKDFCDLASKKYVAGQKEHGGKLWMKAGIIDMAIEEAIDQVIYLFTLKWQIENGTIYDDKLENES